MQPQVPLKSIKILSVLPFVILFTGLQWGPAWGDELTPVGRWKTIDDKTGKPKGIVDIYQQSGKLFGKIEHSFDPAKEKERCEKCPADRKNQPIVGLVVLRNMEKRGDEYSGGDILDPDNGNVYKCKMKLIGGGKTLQVRGFIGFSLLGRNQTWQREP